MLFVLYSEQLDNKQLLDEVDHAIVNYQSQGLPLASADNTDMRFDNS